MEIEKKVYLDEIDGTVDTSQMYRLRKNLEENFKENFPREWTKPSGYSSDSPIQGDDWYIKYICPGCKRHLIYQNLFIRLRSTRLPKLDKDAEKKIESLWAQKIWPEREKVKKFSR